MYCITGNCGERTLWQIYCDMILAAESLVNLLLAKLQMEAFNLVGFSIVKCCPFTKYFFRWAFLQCVTLFPFMPLLPMKLLHFFSWLLCTKVGSSFTAMYTVHCLYYISMLVYAMCTAYVVVAGCFPLQIIPLYPFCYELIKVVIAVIGTIKSPSA